MKYVPTRLEIVLKSKNGPSNNFQERVLVLSWPLGSVQIPPKYSATMRINGLDICERITLKSGKIVNWFRTSATNIAVLIWGTINLESDSRAGNKSSLELDEVMASRNINTR